MKRERTLLLLGLGLTAVVTDPAMAMWSRDKIASAQEKPEPIQRLASIRADYLKALIDRASRDPDIAVAQQPRFCQRWGKAWQNF